MCLMASRPTSNFLSHLRPAIHFFSSSTMADETQSAHLREEIKVADKRAIQQGKGRPRAASNQRAARLNWIENFVQNLTEVLTQFVTTMTNANGPRRAIG